MPLALFVFVGPHSVIRLLNAPRPSSFPPPQPCSTATGGDGDRCGEIQRAVNHRVLAYSRIPFCRSCSSLFADRRVRRSPLAAFRLSRFPSSSDAFLAVAFRSSSFSTVLLSSLSRCGVDALVPGGEKRWEKRRNGALPVSSAMMDAASRALYPRNGVNRARCENERKERRTRRAARGGGP